MSPLPFQSFPDNWLVPGIYVEFDPSRASNFDEAYHALIIAQKRNVGVATADVPVQVVSVEQANNLFGRGSYAARAVEKFRAINPFTRLSVIPVADNGAGVLASGSVNFTGTTGATGNYYWYIGGKRLLINPGNGSAVSHAAALNTAINADNDLPVTSSVATSTVTITARQKGEIGNTIDIRRNAMPGESDPGIGTFAAVITAMTGGSGNPDLTNAIAAMGEDQYQVVVFPFDDSTSRAAIDAELTDRWGPIRAIPGVAIGCTVGTQGSLASVASTLNTPFLTLVGAASFPGMAMDVAAEVGAHVAFQADIDPARPFQTLVMKALPPASADKFTPTEQNLLLLDGISTLRYGPDGTLQVGRLVTTRTLNAFGHPDTAYRDLNDVLTLMFLRASFVARFTSLFPRHKLADKIGPLSDGSSVLTPMVAKAAAASWYREQMADELVQDLSGFLEESTFAVNANDENRLDILLVPRLIGQANVVAVLARFEQ